MQTWLNKLVAWLSRFAITGLTRYLVMLNALVYVLLLAQPNYGSVLSLDMSKIAAGQVWRLVSYLFIPPTTSIIFIVFALSLMWMIGDALEEAWGAFRLNVYYVVGMIGTTIAACLVPGPTTNVFLNTSLFFAFATLFPNFQLLVFFVLPVKVKWLAWISAILLVPPLLQGPWSIRATLIAAYANYLLFFGPQIWRSIRENAKLSERRAQFQIAKTTEHDSLHVCAQCGATEITHPDRDFRVRQDGTEFCNLCRGAS